MNAYRALAEKAEEKRPLRRPRVRLNYNIKIDLIGSPDRAVGIAIVYGLDDRGFGVPVPTGSRIFSSPHRPNRLYGPPSLLSSGY
jgi:hypothetical protein